jgi:hypothetical protein
MFKSLIYPHISDTSNLIWWVGGIELLRNPLIVWIGNSYAIT